MMTIYRTLEIILLYLYSFIFDLLILLAYYYYFGKFQIQQKRSKNVLYVFNNNKKRSLETKDLREREKNLMPI